MRSRLFALFILCIFLFVPGYIFWYFFHSKKASLIFLAPPGTSFHVSLSGKFGLSYFPLFDKVFSYESDCVGSCIFSPIPPLHYDGYYTLSPERKQILSLDIRAGEESRITLEILPTLTHIQKSSIINDDAVLISALVEDANTSLSGKIFPIGQSRSGAILAYQNTRGRSLIGEIMKEGFSPHFSLPFEISRISFDRSKSGYIATNMREETFLVSLDGTIRIPYNLGETPRGVIFGQFPVVTTEKSSYSYTDGVWLENPRFTSFIDLDATTRLGYIDKTDTNKRLLSNISSKESLLFLIDRTTGKSDIISEGEDIDAFIYEDGIPAYIDKEGNIFILSLTSAL